MLPYMVCARRNAFNICLIDRNIPGGTVPGTVRMAVRLSVHLPVSLCLPPALILPALLAAGYVAPYGARSLDEVVVVVVAA